MELDQNVCVLPFNAGHSRRQQHQSWSSLKGYPWYWHVEFETVRYKKYRERIKEKRSKNEVWSDRVEEAFQMAIRIVGRRGRRLYKLNGKLSGGNEFIAEFIKQQTGEDRSRKKVSSHLQVLKNFLRENEAWMSLVVDLVKEKKGRGSSTHEEAAAAYEGWECDDTSIHRLPQLSILPSHNRPLALMDISTFNQGPGIRRVSDFKMILSDKDDGGLRHTYTSIQSETPSAPKALVDVNNWRELYPALVADHDRGPIDCPMYLFDTHLSLMDRPDHSNLEIRLSIDFSQGVQFTEWRSYTKFYERNGFPVELTKSSNIMKITQVEGTDNTRLNLPFRSAWWVRVFFQLIEKKNMMENSGDPVLIKEEEERAIQYIQGLSVMQEVWAEHRDSDRGPQRMAILLWKFNTARRGVEPTTSWRRLLPTLSEYDIQSLDPPFEQPPMTLDTTLPAVSPYAANQSPQPSNFSEYPTGNLPTAPLSKGSSPSTTPAPESRSFLSWTSDSTYTVSASQESLHNSQDSAYPALGIFDTQDSGYSPYERHEVVEASHKTCQSHEYADGSQDVYRSSEVMFHSQDSLYQTTPDQLYDYPYQSVDAPVPVPTCQDFTGGQIQLSYAPVEESQSSSYDAPLIAPQPNMGPQHQLIQHPEHLDQTEYLDQSPGDLGGGQEEVEEEQAGAEGLAQAFELNGLSMDYGGWEETLRLNPDLEHHLGIDVVDEVGRIGQQQYISVVGQEAMESGQGEVVGEVEDEEGTDERQLEYQ